MSNDISGINTRNQRASDRETQDVGQNAGTTDTHNDQGTGRQDKVVLTDMASHLKSLERKLAKQPEVNQDHVNRVRDALSRGEYSLNPDRVADKMMDFEQDL